MLTSQLKDNTMPLPPDLSKPVFSLMPHMADRVMCGLCSFCAKELGEFTSDLSKKEYSVSGMCQVCQDEVFGALEESEVEEEPNEDWLT